MSAVVDVEPLRAGVEDFLPLLVFIVIWWVSSRRGRKKSQRLNGRETVRSSGASGVPEGPNGAVEVSPLEVLWQMVFGGLEMSPMPAPQPSPPVVPLPAESEDVWREVPDWSEGAPPFSATAVMVDFDTSPPEKVKIPLPARKVVSSPPVEPILDRTPLVLARIPLRELQRAVAWSEVLASPVGLRDISH
ncbi:MAG: hypothetical protein KKD63_00400 [Proteobacteria bacterium]|nr:hypothetical protein [Desulfobulbaceae bacterium]MBU4151317.1 hypothetical protein [Pseudomonadota bacterium]